MYKELILELTQNNEYVKIQSPCTGEEIEKAEKAVGYPFPKELWELLYELDGDKYLLLSAIIAIMQTLTELLMKTLSTFGNTKCFVGNK